MKSSVKSSSNAAPKSDAKAKAKEVEIVKLTAKAVTALRVCITTAADADSAKIKAVTTSEQTLLNCSDVVKISGFPSRDSASKYLVTMFKDIYKQAGMAEKYAGEQCARVITFAFPGGKKANPQTREKASQKLMEARLYKKPNGRKLTSNELFAIARGTEALDRKTGKTVKIKSAGSGGSGGHNAKKPLEAFSGKMAIAFTGCKMAKLDIEQLAVAFIDAAKAEGYKIQAIHAAFDKLTSE